MKLNLDLPKDRWDFIKSKLEPHKDDCGDYMFTFYNPPEHWDNSESYWFFKEVNK